MIVVVLLLVAAAEPTVSDPLAQRFATFPASREQVAKCRPLATAFCRFLLVDIQWEEYAAIVLPVDRSKKQLVDEVLDKKSEAMVRLARQFHTLAREQSEWAVAAQCRLAETFLEYANFLLEFDPPPSEPEPEPHGFYDPSWRMTGIPRLWGAVHQFQKTADLATKSGISSTYSRRCAIVRDRVESYLRYPYGAPLP